MNEKVLNAGNDSVEVFMKNLIDYAGLFPPAQLSLEMAINNYISYKRGADSWMLGVFIIPASSLSNLETIIADLALEERFQLSVTGTKTECFIDGFAYGLTEINSFREKHNHKVQIEAFELPIPLAIPKLEELEVLSKMAIAGNVKLFVEVTISQNEDWVHQLLETLDVFAVHNAAAAHSLGVKLRTGGLEARMFPTPEMVALFLKGCADRRLRVKFTAGLHHPVRMYREEVQTEMHGFLNVFTAGIFAYALNLETETLVEILSDENPQNFDFKNYRLAWRDLSVDAAEILSSRSLLTSYGSCSFDEPRDELRELNFLKEV
ncbi:hypothetical protein [Bacillus sp. ISL-39]|uniref:hypothetical protein n=1 Tax=Bacillus sp. ISL-39 TaxID=2819124 RepID=UPI001BE89155|nr:hypothetical protein [Bacillus sp. ISL-39]MBT2639718.1 hypothetical protein [Bacillus sp. ISL-39]